MSKFDFHYDAGHGWLKVHIYDAADVGLYAEDFSAYSYRNGEHLYLEEDCDAGRFLAAWDKALRKFESAISTTATTARSGRTSTSSRSRLASSSTTRSRF
jgi:hypothetical protein